MASFGKTLLKIFAWLVGAAAALVLLMVSFVHLRWESGDGRPAPEMKAPADSASLARGEYIYKYQAHCWGCHQTPSSADLYVPSGGFEFDLTNAGPGFGKWYSRNITPDVETGIGGWTDGEVVQALREGLRKDRSPLFPIMPIDWYHEMSDEDVLAVVGYLRTLPPVKNVVPEREPSFFAKALFTFGMMGPKPRVTETVSAPPRGVTVEWGKYVSNNVADCADCHTPRNLQDGKFYLDSMFAGSSFPYGGGPEGPVIAFARNITPDVETGIGEWTEEHFMEAVTSGMRPDGTVLVPIMPYATGKFWDPVDLAAVRMYLKSLPAVKRTVPPVEFEQRMRDASGVERGALLFEARCQSCHGAKGAGAPATKVTLSEVATGFTDPEIMEFIREGQLNLHMPAFGKTLTQAELADVVAHIRSWAK